MYTGRTVEEAVRKWQEDAKWRVEQISRGLGVDMDLQNRRWYEDGGQVGLFKKTSSRDTIEFKPYKTVRIRRKLGDLRPVGELKNELAVADESGPSDFDTVETLEWAVGTNRSIVDTDSMTHGWSVTVTQGYEIGGDAAGGKYVGGIELGAHGDYSKETAKGLESSVGATKSTQVELPAGQIARIVQTVQSGEVEVDVEDFIVLELGWRVRDWKHTNNQLLKDHVGFGGKERSKSRWHWDCLDAYDLLTLGEGTNPRYPGSRGQRLIDRKDIGDDIAWLLDENRRTVYVKTTAKFKQGIMGKGRVQRVHPDGTTEEEDAD